MDGNSMVSCKDEVGSARKLEKFDWKEEQQLPSGWSCKISRRLRRPTGRKVKSFLQVGASGTSERSPVERKGKASFRMELQDQQEVEEVRLEGKARASFRMERQG